MNWIKTIFIFIYQILKKIIVWSSEIENIKNIKTGLTIINTLFGNLKNKKAVQFINNVQEMVDNICKISPNYQVDELKTKINQDSVTLGLGNFNAGIIKDKHGPGNNGIILGFNTDIGKIEYDPTNGDFNGQITLHN